MESEQEAGRVSAIWRQETTEPAPENVQAVHTDQTLFVRASIGPIKTSKWPANEKASRKTFLYYDEGLQRQTIQAQNYYNTSCLPYWQN